MASPAEWPRNGWVLYDGNCGFCSDWVPRWRNVLQRRGFAIDTLQNPWVNERLRLDDAALISDIRLLLRDGRNLKGADVYRYVMQRIWWAWPVYFLSVLPGLGELFDIAYRRFADNRYWISRTCHIPITKARREPD